MEGARPTKKPNSCVINESPFNQRTICTPQSRAFINALLLNFFARSDFIDTMTPSEMEGALNISLMK